MGSHLFTPHLLDRTRLRLHLSTADKALFDSLPYRSRRTVIVTDLDSGTRYTVRRASCGAGCYCAALATPVEEV